jgi:2-keto-3-deoxy-L-rhamnonate aldolase RhmA
MRGNPVKTRLAAGEPVFGTMAFEFFTPGLPQIVKSAGAEFLLLDMEHSGTGIDVMKQQISYCRGLDLVPLVRVPRAHYHFVARLLDAGALGIMVPMVETPEEAARIVAWTRYPPQGVRGAAFGVAGHDDYEGGVPRDLIAAANERVLTIVQIETARGAEQVEAIAAVPGVDVLWLGHFDLTNFMGIPGEFTHQRYLAAVDALVAACRLHGKAAGFMALDEAWARDYRARGFDIIAYGTDVGMLRAELARGLAGLRGTSKA